MRLSRFILASLLTISISLGSPTKTFAAGPDPFGYTSISSAEAGGPSFNFIDISITGTRLTFFDADSLPVQNANADDGVAINIDLSSLNGGRGFPFYGGPSFFQF